MYHAEAVGSYQNGFPGGRIETVEFTGTRVLLRALAATETKEKNAILCCLKSNVSTTFISPPGLRPRGQGSYLRNHLRYRAATVSFVIHRGHFLTPTNFLRIYASLFVSRRPSFPVHDAWMDG
jgi:hypothetical protein